MAAALQRFRREVDDAVGHVRALLGASRNPSFPADAAHAYADKYSLVEIGSRQALNSARAALDVACDGGFSKQQDELAAWVRADQVVTLCMKSEERCEFIESRTREVASKTKRVTETTSSLFGTSKTTTRTVTTASTSVSWPVACLCCAVALEMKKRRRHLLFLTITTMDSFLLRK